MSLKELCYLLKSAKSVEEINEKREEIAKLIPNVRIMFDYDQGNYAHQYDLWFHSIHTVMGLPRLLDDDMLYLAALLHDIGKPASRCRGKDESDLNWHYYGHPEKSYEIVRDIVIPHLRSVGEVIGKEEEERLLYYVLYHDDHVSLRVKHLRRHLGLVDMNTFQLLMLLQVADAKAHIMIPVVQTRVEVCSQLASDFAIQRAKEFHLI